VEQVVDCLDLRRSCKPKRLNGEVEKSVFRPDTVPAELPAFRIPQFRTAVYFHPDPWGFLADRDDSLARAAPPAPPLPLAKPLRCCGAEVRFRFLDSSAF
jgi:hypothetical protein